MVENTNKTYCIKSTINNRKSLSHYLLHKKGIVKNILVIRSVPIHLFFNILTHLSNHISDENISTVVQQSFVDRVLKVTPAANIIPIDDQMFSLMKNNRALFKTIKKKKPDLIVLPYNNTDGTQYGSWEFFLFLTGVKVIGVNSDYIVRKITAQSILTQFFTTIVWLRIIQKVLWLLFLPLFFILSLIEPLVLGFVHFICHFQDRGR